MADPEIGMKVDECLNGHSALVVSASNFRANQINNALRNEGLASSLESALPNLAQSFNVAGVPEQVVRTIPQPAFSPAPVTVLERNA